MYVCVREGERESRERVIIQSHNWVAAEHTPEVFRGEKKRMILHSKYFHFDRLESAAIKTFLKVHFTNVNCNGLVLLF